MSSLINFSTSQSTKQQQGFTLLELVLVMLIIGLVASTPLVFIDNQDNQFRYEETLKKLELIERAVYLPQTYRSEPVLSGFVIDNGILPPVPASSALQPLISKDGTWDIDGTDEWPEYRDYNPYIVIASGATPASISGYPQYKGYRGNYLNEGLDSSRELRDGWGVEYTVSNSGAIYTATYEGLNAVHPTSYNTPASVAVKSEDWRVPLNEIDIHLTVPASGASHSVALIVFQNDHSASAATDSSLWTTYHFTVASGAGHSFSENWHQNGFEMDAASVAATNIPAGQHPIFVVETAVPDNPVDYDRLLVIPGATQPSLQFEVD